MKRAITPQIKAGKIMQLRTHSPEECHGEHCCIHNPSNRHMRAWPLHWREDKGTMERICPHGIGHPDPDAVAHDAKSGRKDTTHGCDGCCVPSTKQRS